MNHNFNPKAFSIKSKLRMKLNDKFVPLDPRVHGIRQSDLSTFLQCRQQAKLSQYFCLRSIMAKKAAFVQGSMYHDALEKIYRGIRDGKIKDMKGVSTALTGIANDTMKNMPDDASSREVTEDTLTKLRPVMLAYFQHYQDDFNIVWRTIEGRFTVNIAPGVKITGTMDGGFMKKKKFCVFESKFRSRIDADNITDVLALDLQLTFYTVAASLYGYELGKRRYNIVRKPELRQKQNEGKVEFGDRILEEMTKHPKDYFFREDSDITVDDIKKAKARLTRLCEEYLAWWDSLAKGSQDPTVLDFLANPGHCEHKYGVCEFLPLCANGDTSGHITVDPESRKVQTSEGFPKP
jgi:hypothetical protein